MAITEQPKRPKILSRLTIGEIALLAWNYVVVVRILPWSAGLVWWAGLLLILGGPLAIAVSIIGFRTETRAWIRYSNVLMAATYVLFWAWFLRGA